MATRKDLLKAQQFTTRRLVLALAERNPDDPSPHIRRTSTATFVSILLAIVLCAGSALLGMFKKQVDVSQWQDPSVVVQDAGSGQLFVWNDDSKELRPMRDIASARLLAGAKKGELPATVTVKTSDIQGVEQMHRFGIPGAPFQLPLPTSLVGYPVRVCASKPIQTSQNVSDAQRRSNRYLSVEFGATAPQSSVDMAATTPDGATYLVLGGTVHLIQTNGHADALVGDLPLMHLSAAFLNALPIGAPIQDQSLEGMGGTPQNGSHSIGTLLRTGDMDAPGTNYYIQTANGLVQISYVDMRLWQVTKGGEPAFISSGDASAHMASGSTSFGTPGLPRAKPKGPASASLDDDVSTCVSFPGGEQSQPVVSLDVEVPANPPNTQPSNTTADTIVMKPLTGVLLQTNSADIKDGPTFLITEKLSFGIPDGSSRRALGYGDNAPLTLVPPGVIRLFRSGLQAGTSLSADSVQPI